jgi:hypothetical protein
MGIGRQSVCLSGCCLAGADGRRAAAVFKEPLRDLGGFFVSAGCRPYTKFSLKPNCSNLIGRLAVVR